MHQVNSVGEGIPAPDFQQVFNALPGSFLLLQPNPPQFTILAASDEQLRLTGQEQHEVVGKSVFEAYPENPNASSATGPAALRESFMQVLKNKIPDQLPVVRYDALNADGKFEERYWKISNKPVLDAEGNVRYILHTQTEATQQVTAEKKATAIREIEKKYSLFMQAPVAVYIVTGPENTVELANEEMLKLLSRTTDIIGKPLFESIPEIIAHGFPELLVQVRETGQPYFGKEYPSKLIKDGQETLCYYNFVYQPYYANPGDTVAGGVFCVAHDVTEQVLARQKVEESEQQLRSFIESSHHPIGVYIGSDMRIQFANQALKDGLGKGNDIVGKPYKDVLPELENQQVFELLETVYRTGKSFEAKNHKLDLVVGGELRTFYFDFSFTPLYNTAGEVYGVINTGADVTELYQARERIAESEWRYRTLIEEAPIATALYLNSDNKLQYANNIMLGYWGKDSTIVGKPLREALPEPAAQPFLDLLEKVYASGETYIGVKEKAELEIDGRLESAYFNYTYKPLLNKDGEVYGIHHTAIDVTEEVLVQKRLEESEARFRNMIEQAPVAIALTWGEDMVIENVNAPMLQIMGRETADKVNGKKLVEALPEVKDQPVLEIVREVLKTGKTITADEQLVYLLKKGNVEPHYLNLSYTPLKEEGVVTGVIHVALDVTEQVEARKKIEQSARDLQNLANAMPQIVWIASPEGNVTYYNERVSEFSGATKLPNGNWHWESMLIEEDEQPTIEAWEKAVRTGTPYEIEHRLRMRDGSHRWHLSRALPQRDSEGKVTRWFGTATDVHDRKEHQEAIEVKNRHLISINNDLDNFIYTASHDLKAPIINIEGLLALLPEVYAAEGNLSSDTQEILEMMKGSVERFKKTIDSLTDVAKLQQENEYNTELVNVAGVIEEVTLDLAPLIRSTQAVLEINVAPDTAVRFSGKNLRSVIYNLLSNAIKYKAADRVPRVQISCHVADYYHVLTFTDNGLGMSPGQRSGLFTMFKRFHSHVEGTGIGLYMVKKIVENAHGKIEVESKENVGTTFRVYLPI
ncbi:PAS domain-containing protein [Pontibacter sp. BT310]|uniref:histidine kinase n=1 Tax=Pontibacter populi TaxID=890055 RepID=A0ABS6XEL6_9BACT|nr:MULTISPECIES: PAS domain-containing protein [Pontibacter]MBJ6119245.1 PAS domain-containing protein [Pontibacter sp. BT310]MBR0571673.1 PAS domain-containing protein [Microvirga sp. STS03]MBW3366099.1 PAS domain-containing protein [Pontibacter populi]